MWSYNSSMVLLGLDFGTKRIGVAVCDGPGWAARGVATIQRKGSGRDLEAVCRLARELRTEAVVVGLPLNMDGSESRMAGLARKFAESIEERLGIEVHLFDERLTSFEAEEVLSKSAVKRDKRRRLIDQVAAALILKGFSETKKEGVE